MDRVLGAAHPDTMIFRSNIATRLTTADDVACRLQMPDYAADGSSDPILVAGWQLGLCVRRPVRGRRVS
jgi:hypothetical protein